MQTSLLLTILLLLIPLPVTAQVLKTDPSPAQGLKNPVDLTLSLALGTPETRNLDWRNPKLIIDGTDYTRAIQPLLDGAVAVYLSSDRAVMAERKVSESQVEIRIYGFTAPLGPHQVLVEFPRKDGKPLRYQTMYVVLP